MEWDGIGLARLQFWLQKADSRYCQVKGTKPRFSPKLQESRNLSTDADHLSPIGKSPGSEESMMNGLKMITIDSKQVLNGTVN